MSQLNNSLLREEEKKEGGGGKKEKEGKKGDPRPGAPQPPFYPTFLTFGSLASVKEEEGKKKGGERERSFKTY